MRASRQHQLFRSGARPPHDEMLAYIDMIVSGSSPSLVCWVRQTVGLSGHAGTWPLKPGLPVPTEHLAKAGLTASVGTAGDAYDNALAETVNGLYKIEVIYARPAWPSATEVEFGTTNWVHWWNITQLHEALK